MWQNNQFIKLVGAPNSFVHHLALGETVVAVSSAMDPGGVSKITTVASSQWTCCNGQGICSLTQPSSTPRVTTQPGDVGDTVSNGVWTGFIVSTPGCASGFTLGSFSFGWWTIAEDFHGNESTSAIQSIVYP